MPVRERAIHPADLAQKTLALEKVAEGLYFIRQELSHHLQHIQFLPADFEMLLAEIDHIIDLGTLETALQTLQKMTTNLRAAEQFVQAIYEFNLMFNNLLTLHGGNEDQTITEQIRRLSDHQYQLQSELISHAAEYQTQLNRLREIIQVKAQLLP